MSIKEIVTLLCEAREALDELEVATLPDSLRAIAAKLDQALDAALILEKQAAHGVLIAEGAAFVATLPRWPKAT